MGVLNNVLMVLILMAIIIFVGKAICKIPLFPHYGDGEIYNVSILDCIKCIKVDEKGKKVKQRKANRER